LKDGQKSYCSEVLRTQPRRWSVVVSVYSAGRKPSF